MFGCSYQPVEDAHQSWTKHSSANMSLYQETDAKELSIFIDICFGCNYRFTF